MGSLFDGISGFPAAGLLNGIETKWVSEIEPFCIKVSSARFPNAKQLGSVTDINGADIEPVDIITFGSPCQDLSVAGKQLGIHEGQRSNLFFEAIRIIKEMRNADEVRGRSGKSIRPRFAVWENVCFTADTLVACHGGYKRIADIAVGDNVRTLSGEYHPVARLYKTPKQEVMKVKVSGGEDLTVTPNHPFYVREKIYVNAAKKRIFSEPTWIRADELTKNHLVGYLIDKPTLPDDFISSDEAWAIGRWIADGSVDLSKSSQRIFISCGLKKADATRKRLNMLKYNIHENHPHPTAINFAFTSNDFYALISQVGCGAGNKKIPQYVFELPRDLQREVLQGYIDGDGYVRQRGKCIELTANTASRELAYGVARLIRDVYGVAANITRREAKDGKIGDRVIHANYPSYAVTASLTSAASPSYNDGNIVWQPVYSVERLKERQNVYNLSVLEDNTYGANDVLVHNCGAMSSNKGKDFRSVLQAFCEIGGGKSTDDVPMPQKGRWEHNGCIVGDGYSLAWKVLDAQYCGVHQRRKRIYLVADFGSERAGEILLVKSGVSGHFTESRETREGIAADAERSIGRSCGIGYLKKWDTELISRYLLGRGGVRITSQSVSQSVSQSAAGFKGNQGAKAGSVGFGIGVVPTLTAQQICHTVYALQGNGIDRADTAGCNGKGWRTDEMYTLNTIERPAVCYGVDCRNATLDEEKTHTLQAKANGGISLNCTPSVVYPINTMVATRHNKDDGRTCLGIGEPGDPQFTLSAAHEHAVVYRNGGYGEMTEGVGTLRANGGDAGGELKASSLSVYDARGNGDGQTVPTLTGDHQNRVTDYTSIIVETNDE